VAEATCPGGALIFRAKVLDRSCEDHTICLERPSEVRKIDRREHRRWPEFAGMRLEIEGCDGRILDLAAGGIRVRSACRTGKGDRVKIELPWGETVFGWVLSREGEEVRVRFEELVAPQPSQQVARV